jgi:predicted DNA-binding helix-hairpin-helix protein
VLINFCSIEELMPLPGIGAKGADKILEMREAKGDLELEDLSHVPYLRLIPQLIKCLDFTPFEEGEGLGEKRGSLDKRLFRVVASAPRWNKSLLTRVMI